MRGLTAHGRSPGRLLNAEVDQRETALANKKTRREPLEEPSAPVQALSRTGRRASHLDGLALCVSTFASAGEPIPRPRRPASRGGLRLSQRAGKSGARAG